MTLLFAFYAGTFLGLGLICFVEGLNFMAFCSLPGANWNARARRHRMTANTSRSAKHKKRFCFRIGGALLGDEVRVWHIVRALPLFCAEIPPRPEKRHLFWILWLILSRCCLFAMAWYSLAYNMPIPIRLASTAQHCNRWGHYGVGGPKGRCWAGRAGRAGVPVQRQPAKAS